MDTKKYLAKPNESIFEHVEKLKMHAENFYKLGYLSEDEYLLLIKCCEYHDLGKANPEFQNRILSKTKFNEDKEIYHNILSSFFVKPEDFNKEDFLTILAITLFHHAYMDIDGINTCVDEQQDLINNLLFDFSSEIQSISRGTIRKIHKNFLSDNSLSDLMRRYFIIKGFLHKCDYAASANLSIEVANTKLLENLENLGYKWNEPQKFMISNRDKNVVLVAPTGIGKTEASLLWAGNEKTFFFLPLKVTTNAIYNRINNIMEHQNVGLLHSDNFSELLKTNNNPEDILKSTMSRSKQFLDGITVSTIDQLFEFVFKYNTFEYKLATLSKSKIIVDELQMYDPRMLASIIYGLKMICEMGGKIAIVTATLAPFINDLLDKHVGGFTKNIASSDLKRHNVKVVKKELSGNVVTEILEKKKHKKYLVICNTVKKAQRIYDGLRTKYDNVYMLHSKYIHKDRMSLEESILRMGNINYDEPCIWITTQIVEASLDIDFDCLITELSDLQSLFQRMGRCNRKGLKSADDYNIYVFTDIAANLLNKVVDKKIYELSKEAILTIDGVLSEQKKNELIDNYLTTDNMKTSEFMIKFRKHYGFLESLPIYRKEANEERLRQIDNCLAIPLNIYQDNSTEIIELVDTINGSNVKSEVLISANKLQDYVFSLRASEIKLNIEDSLEMKNLGQIFIIDCDYDNKMGFRQKTKLSGSFI